MDFWGALMKPKEIGIYNWAEYVIDHLIEAARKAQFDMQHKSKVSNVSSCPLLIQILHLDNLDFAAVNVSHNVQPRVRVYDTKRLNRMIIADTLGGKPKPGQTPVYGIKQSRARAVTSYEVNALTPPANAPAIRRNKSSQPSTGGTQHGRTTQDPALGDLIYIPS